MVARDDPDEVGAHAWRHLLLHLLLLGALRRLEPARVGAASRLDCVCACTMEAPNFCHAANALACGRAPICAIWFLSRGGPSENSSHHICAISLTDIHSCFSQRLMIIYVRPLLVDCKLEIACCLPHADGAVDVRQMLDRPPSPRTCTIRGHQQVGHYVRMSFWHGTRSG